MSTSLSPRPLLPILSYAIETFEQQLGGREVLVEVLAQADSSDTIQRILSFLGNADHQHNSLATVCLLADCTPGDLFLAYERALKTRAKVLASIPIARELPYVAEDAMRRARTHKVLCPECNGTRHVKTRVKGEVVVSPCQWCEEGWINQEPSLDQQKLALELGELVQRSGGTSIHNENVQETKTLNVGLGASLAKLQAEAAKIVFTTQAVEPPEPAT